MYLCKETTIAGISYNRRMTALLLILAISLISQFNALQICNYKELSSSEVVMPAKLSPKLDLFINKGVEYHPLSVFMDVFLWTNLTDQDTYELYQGANCTAVINEYSHDNSLFGLLKSVSIWKSQQLNPFNDTVIGISTYLPYRVSIKTWRVNYIRASMFVGGIVLFLFAKNLVRNTVFYYTSGCTFGILASLLLFVFVIYRIAPKRMIGLPILIGGWSISLYILHFAWSNFTSIMLQYQKFVAAYFVAVLLISLAVCYKRGPPTDSRSHDIAQWTLQLIALTLIYFSAQIPEVPLTFTSALILHQLTRSWLWSGLQNAGSVGSIFWRKLFPPKPRFQTKEEYKREGEEVTKRELDKLRNYCRSPEANVWKITGSVKNPKRFARFVDGSEGHVLEEEERSYDYEADIIDREDLDGSIKNFCEDDDSEWEEIIIRRTPKTRHDIHSNIVRPSSSHSVRVRRGVSARLISDRLNSTTSDLPIGTSSGLRPQKTSKVVSLTTTPELGKNFRHKRRSTEIGLRSKGKIITSHHSPSSEHSEFFSSDSEQDVENLNFSPGDKLEFET